MPRITLLLTIGTLLSILPPWFIAIRRRPKQAEENAVVIGNDPEEINRILTALDSEPIGYVAPSSLRRDSIAHADGGLEITQKTVTVDLEYLGGLSRIENIIIEHDVDTSVFAFATTNRQEFFGALGVCHDHGVKAKIHREYTDSVLVPDAPGEELVNINVEPWDWQDRAIKRLFDISFALCGLIVLSPVILCIAVAIKLDDGGPLLYSQERTTELGKTFEVYRFRSMIDNAEDDTGATLSEEDRGGVDPRVTRVGSISRQTHLDEIPQLWSIVNSDMSVVGPRP